MRSSLVTVVRRAWLSATAMALFSSACGQLPTAAAPTGPTSLVSFDDRGHAALERGHNFASLHPTVRGLLAGPELEHTFVEHGVVDLPLASCESAVSFQASAAHECSLVALAAFGGAVLVISKAGECREGDCMEHSWAFLDVYDVPFALPARRASDYQALRQDLSREDASALWLAGFRGRSPGARFAQLDDPYAQPEIVSYQSCRVAPDSHELVCRSAEGDVLGLDPVTSQQRLIAKLGVEAAQAPVWWTRDGKLAAAAGAGQHPQCTGPCPLVALLDWPNAGAAQLVPARLVR